MSGRRKSEATPLGAVGSEHVPKSVQRNTVWSKLLGCDITITRKVKILGKEREEWH